MTTVPGLANFYCLFGEFDSRYVFLIRNTRPNEGALLIFGRICEELDLQVRLIHDHHETIMYFDDLDFLLLWVWLNIE